MSHKGKAMTTYTPGTIIFYATYEDSYKKAIRNKFMGLASHLDCYNPLSNPYIYYMEQIIDAVYTSCGIKV